MIRFLADASLHDAIVKGCLRRERTIDFLSSNDANLEEVPDPDVLALAASEGRILVTSDLRTMPGHFGDFLEAGGSSPGVFLVKQKTPVADVIEALLLVWAASDPEEWENRIIRIPVAVTGK
jgi:predicted nuclease of predicted toxin-antitoxin system